MAHTNRDPLAGTSLLLIDGTNLLHALARGPQLLPAAALIGRLRAVIPPAVAIEVCFDGAPAPGMRRERVAAGLTVRYAGPRSADAEILARAEQHDAEADGAILVVSDDRGLRSAVERLGGRTARNAWLLGRLERTVLAAPSVGNARSPRASRGGPARGTGGEAADRDPGTLDGEPRWRPGRGATVKRGNPRRAPRT